MVSIRPYEERDNARLLEIESMSPQGNKDIAMGVDKSHDAIGRYRLLDNWKMRIYSLRILKGNVPNSVHAMWISGMRFFSSGLYEPH